ncbi:MAG TPA: energy transducer TonB [Thermoanaerobaculia bacterium]|nr:energy transducer TonB [Thermoanaerobaculia bacterium]
MEAAVEEILAARRRRSATGPAVASLTGAALLHGAVAAAILLLPRLHPPPPPLEYVTVQVVPAQALGAPQPAPPAPKPHPEAERPPAPKPAAPAPETPVLPPPKPPKAKPEKPKPPPPDTRIDPTTRPKVLPPPRELLDKKLGTAANTPAGPKPAPPGPATGTASGKVAVGSLTASPDNPDFNYDYYTAQTLSRIEENWTRSPVGSGVHTVISFRIHSDGGISDLKVSASSGFDTFDLAALRAVQNAAPFLPLPRAWTASHDSVSVNWIAR